MRDEEFNDADNAAEREYSRGRLAGIKASERRYLEIKAWAEKARDFANNLKCDSTIVGSGLSGLLVAHDDRGCKKCKLLSSLPKELREEE